MIKKDLTILDDLFSLWESLSLAGEISIGSRFSKSYIDMKDRIKNFKTSQEANCFPQQNQKRKRELITKHLEGCHGLKLSSIQYFAEHGKASGSFLQGLESLLSDYSASLIKENEELKAKVRELELPRGVKLCDCPECGAEIQFGISEELKEKFKNIKLRK